MQRLLFFLVLFLRLHTTDPFQLRLTGGPSLCAGRVEILHQGQWGTVCDDDWDTRDAGVVCRELDCGVALSAPHGAWFGEGDGPIWLNEVRCTGTERHLHTCRHLGFRKHVCTHEEDASVMCSAQRFAPFTAFPPHTTLRRNKVEMVATVRPIAEGNLSLRLVGGSSRCSGRLEVFHDGQWGTVCDDMWDLLDVAVVCRELNCGEAVAAPNGAFFGEGNSGIWLDDVQCQGDEATLTECHKSPWGTNNCRHNEDAGAVCSGEMPLAMAEEHVVMLSQSVASERPQSTAYRILDPTQPTRTNQNLMANEVSPAEITLRENSSEELFGGQWQLRLEGGPGSCAGRVEVLFKDQWGTVCDDGWDLVDAAVVCRELGCGAPLLSPGNARYGPGSGPIWLDDVNCTGAEFTLRRCRAQPWGKHNCNHHEDASVICTGRWKRLLFPKSSRQSKTAELTTTTQDPGPLDTHQVQSTLNEAVTTAATRGLDEWEMLLLNQWNSSAAPLSPQTVKVEIEKETKEASPLDVTETTPNLEVFQHVQEMEPTSVSEILLSFHKTGQEPTYPTVESQLSSGMWDLQSERETEPSNPWDVQRTRPYSETLQHVQEMEPTRLTNITPASPKFRKKTISPSVKFQPATAIQESELEGENEPSPSGTELLVSAPVSKLATEMEPPVYWDNMLNEVSHLEAQEEEPTNPSATVPSTVATMAQGTERDVESVNFVESEPFFFSEMLLTTNVMEQPTVTENIQSVVETTNFSILEPKKNIAQQQEEESNTEPYILAPAATPEYTLVPSDLYNWNGTDLHSVTDLPHSILSYPVFKDEPTEDGLATSRNSEMAINTTSTPGLPGALHSSILLADSSIHATKSNESSSGCPVRSQTMKENQVSCCSSPSFEKLTHAMEGLRGELVSLSTAIQHQGSQLEAVSNSLAQLAASVHHLVGALPALMQPNPVHRPSFPSKQDERQMQNQLPLK